MAFPTTGLLDNFNRANENPLAGPSAQGFSWNKSGVEADAVSLVSNVATGSASGGGFSYITVPAGGPGVEAYLTINAIPTADFHAIGVYICLGNPSSASLFNG